MADIFSTDNARDLFHDKFIFMLGDSNMRATYKDMVQLVNRNALLNQTDLRKRGELEFMGDKRIVHSGMIKGRGYAEGREFLNYGIHMEYHFITRCYTSEIERFLHRIKEGLMKTPDVFIMNSCLWDISRWGPNGVNDYKENMKKLMHLLTECLPKRTLFIWTTTLPVSSLIRGGLLIKQIDFLQDLLRFEVMEANLFCRHLVVSHGYDVLDTHYYLRMQIHRRIKDGLHYGPLPVRFITNLLLTHISLSWDVPLPGNFQGVALERIINCGVLQSPSKSSEIKFPHVPDCLKLNEKSTKAKKTEKTVSSKTDNYRRYNANGNHNNYQNNNYQIKNKNFTNTSSNHKWRNNQNKVAWNKPRTDYRETPRNDHCPPWLLNRPNIWNPVRETSQIDFRNQNFWQDRVEQRFPKSIPPWSSEYTDHHRSPYSNFNKVGGPVRQNRYHNDKRPRPY